MSSSDLHEALFKWPHSEPSDVVVTGSFDGWSRTIHLSRTPNGFAGTVKIPWGQKTSYKYIVDGRWTTTDTQPTEMDPMGNVNNVYNAPTRPIQPRAEAPPAVLAPAAVTPASIKPEPAVESTPKTSGVVATAKETAVGMVEAIAPGTTEKSEPADLPAATPEPTLIESTTAAVKGAASTASEASTAVAAAAASVVSAAVHVVSEAVLKEESPAEQTSQTIAPDAPIDPEPQPAEPEASPEVAPESILPRSADVEPVAPTVPVSILPLTASPEVPVADGSDTKPAEPSIVEGAVTSEDAPLPPAKDVSTHAPVIVNGQATVGEPTAVVLPPITPSEAPTAPPVPTTAEEPTPAPAPAPAASVSSAPVDASPAHPAPTSPASENGHQHSKRLFPSLRSKPGHRHSSSGGSQTEFSETPTATSTVSSRMNSQRKQRKSSFFGKIKDIFHHDHKEKVGK